MIAEILATTIATINVALHPPIYLPMYATAYCLTGTTASGMQTKYGICANGHREWLGKEAVVYQRLPDGTRGKCIGTFEIEDTGCSDFVIDVWKPTLDECQEFMEFVYEDGCKGHILVELREIE